MRYTVDFDGREWIDGEYVNPYTRDDEFALSGLDWIHKRDSSCAWETGLPLLWEEFGELELHILAEDMLGLDCELDIGPGSARAHGRCEAARLTNRLYMPGWDRPAGKGGIRKESKRWGRGCGWKEHRPYQQHGRARVPKRVDVVDWLHGLYPGVWKS
jgi:hypothetical protein